MKTIRYFSILCLAAVFCAADLFSQPTITFFDIGDGSTVHLEIGYNHYLFDVGPKTNSSKLIDYLSKQSATSIKGIFLTHTHPDHAGALLELISQIPTDAVYWNEELPNNEDLVQELDQAALISPFHLLHPGDKLKLSREVQLMVLDQKSISNNPNNKSLVYKLVYHGKSILLTGDIGTEGQNNLAKSEKSSIKKPDIFLWPHHGDQLTESFQAALSKADICVVSVGKNAYDLPSSVFEIQSNELCGTLVRTDQNGMARFHLGRKIRASLDQSRFQDN